MIWSKAPFITLFLSSSLLLPAQEGKTNLQQPQAADERFRVSTYLVTVDVVVTGKKGKPVMNLKPEDFAIFEDDVSQTIELFQVDPGRSHQPVTVQMPPAEGNGEEKKQSQFANPETSNLLVLLLDYSTTTVANQRLVRDGARRYLEKSMDGRDSFAIFAFDTRLRALQNVTRDREKLMAALDYSGARGDAIAGERGALSQGASDMVEKQKMLTQQIGNLVGAAGSGAPGPALGAAVSMVQAELDMARQAELQYFALKSSLDDQLSRSVLLAIQAIAEGLARFPGRKTLVLLSQGFTVPPNVRRILDSTLTASVRSNVAIYAIDARGLVNDKPVFETTELESISALQRGSRTRVVNGESQFDRAAMIGTDQEESLLRYMSNFTGGMFLRNNNDLSRGLQRVDEDVHAQYHLAYTTTNRKLDGSFRAIRVELRPKDLKVRARKGYFATP